MNTTTQPHLTRLSVAASVPTRLPASFLSPPPAIIPPAPVQLSLATAPAPGDLRLTGLRVPPPPAASSGAIAPVQTNLPPSVPALAPLLVAYNATVLPLPPVQTALPPLSLILPLAPASAATPLMPPNVAAPVQTGLPVVPALAPLLDASNSTISRPPPVQTKLAPLPAILPLAPGSAVPPLTKAAAPAPVQLTLPPVGGPALLLVPGCPQVRLVPASVGDIFKLQPSAVLYAGLSSGVLDVRRSRAARRLLWQAAAAGPAGRVQESDVLLWGLPVRWQPGGPWYLRYCGRGRMHPAVQFFWRHFLPGQRQPLPWAWIWSCNAARQLWSASTVRILWIPGGRPTRYTNLVQLDKSTYMHLICKTLATWSSMHRRLLSRSILPRRLSTSAVEGVPGSLLRLPVRRLYRADCGRGVCGSPGGLRR